MLRVVCRELEVFHGSVSCSSWRNSRNTCQSHAKALPGLGGCLCESLYVGCDRPRIAASLTLGLKSVGLMYPDCSKASNASDASLDIELVRPRSMRREPWKTLWSSAPHSRVWREG